MIQFNTFHIPDLDNIRIDFKVKSVSCSQPEKRKVIKVCSILIFKVNYHSRLINFDFEDRQYLNVRINTKIKSLACIY